jgi:hypothetical protein
MKISVVTWNMHSDVENWKVLAENPELRDADVFLLCEAAPWKGILPERLRAVGHGSTRGIGCRCEGEGCEYRTYSTAIAVASRHKLLEMPEDTRVEKYSKEPVPFEPSRAGSWTAARVDLDGLGEVLLTAIALYGLSDEAYEASLHRSLSELSPVFDPEDLSKYLVLGGDFNVLPEPRGERMTRGQVVMERTRAYGLEDCFQLTSPGPGEEAEHCTCKQPDTCTHRRTFIRKGKFEHVPYQDDYLFASSGLTGNGRLKDCKVLSVHDFYPGSDHAPVVAQFEV